MLNNFITALMSFIGAVMFVCGMAFLAGAVISGYFHYIIWYYAVALGFAGWFLFFSGMNLVQQYKAADQAVTPVYPDVPMPQPVNPYGGGDTAFGFPGNATAGKNSAIPFGGQQSHTPPLDAQIMDDD